MNARAVSPRRIGAVVAALAGTLVSPASAQTPCQPTSAQAPDYAATSTCESDPPPFRLLNIAGRAQVREGDGVLIGGFIIAGELPVRVIMRGIGPSLQSDGSGLNGRLANPTLELRGGLGELIAENDDWPSSEQADQIRATGLAPREDREAAIVATLRPGAYTAIMRGAGEPRGIGVIEIYDLQASADAKLANLAARAFVSTGDNVLIGGFIIQGGPPEGLLVRAIGSSLAGIVPNELQDPTLEIINAEGVKIGENDNWREGRNAAEVEATGAPPTHELESAVVVTPAAGLYTVTVRGANNRSGIGVVEIYRLD